jgi:hypothetical protein
MALALAYHALRERGTLHPEKGQNIVAAASIVGALSMVGLVLLMDDVR